MTMSGNSAGRKEVLFERRETSLLGNALPKRIMVDKSVQFEVNMDIGSGDSYNIGNDNSYGNDISYTNDNSYSTYGSHSTTFAPTDHSTFHATSVDDTSPPILRDLLHRAKSKDNLVRAKSKENLVRSKSKELLSRSRSIDNLEISNHVSDMVEVDIDESAQTTTPEDPTSNTPNTPTFEEIIREVDTPLTSVNETNTLQKSSSKDNFFKAKSTEKLDKVILVNETKTRAVVEDKSNIVTTEANPSVPSPNEEHSRTSTLRINERQRSGKSESEDDIEKMDEEPDGGRSGSGIEVKSSSSSNKQNNPGEIKDKNFALNESPQDENDSDCAVQCLYYTIQCCECNII